MKKSISIILSLALLLGSIASVAPLTAAATNTAWVQDFSAYDSDNRLEKTASVIAGDAEHGSILDFIPNASGNAFASVFPGSGTAKQDTAKLLKSGVTYDVSLEYIINQAPGTASGDFGSFNVSLIAADNTTYWDTSSMTLVEQVVYGAETNSWKSKTLSLTPATDSYLVLRIGTNKAVQPFMDISVDNVKVVEVPTGLNDPTTWVCDSPANYATATKTGAKSTDVYYEAEGTVSDGRSVKLNGWNRTAKVAVEKNSTYTLSFWHYSDKDQTTNNFRLTSVMVQDIANTSTANGAASHEAVGTGRYLSAYKDAVWNNIDAWQAKNNATNAIPGEQSTWHYFEAEFKTENSTEIFITMTGNEFYLDDIKLTKQVTVTFETNGGTEVEVMTGIPNDAIGTLPQPTKDGYTFAGWYTNAALTTPFEATAFPQADITLYAKWTENIPLVAEDVEFTHDGVSIRREGVQALRYKFTMPRAAKGKTDYSDGYELVEYGSLVMRTDWMDGATLEHGVLYNNTAAIEAIAYNAKDGTDIVFEMSDQTVTYTAALTDIDEPNYAVAFTVRPYAKYQKGDEVYYEYGEAQDACIYTAMQTIEQYYTDYADDPTSCPISYEKVVTDYTELVQDNAGYASWKGDTQE